MHSDLVEPKISTLYENNQFVDLRQLGRKEDGTVIIPDPVIEPTPQELTKELDSLFERYGYIPHL